MPREAVSRRPGGTILSRADGAVWMVLSESTHLADDKWVHRCGNVVQGQTVHHHPENAGGRVQTEEVPYCPVCEVAPSPHGTFITVAREW